jgi:hypothetical protein
LSTKLTKSAVPLELEKGEMPLNTYNNKAPFVAKIKSVEKIVGPKATGETYHIIIETGGKIPFWEGQSYGVIPPVSPGTSRWGELGRVSKFMAKCAQCSAQEQQPKETQATGLTSGPEQRAGGAVFKDELQHESQMGMRVCSTALPNQLMLHHHHIVDCRAPR